MLDNVKVMGTNEGVKRKMTEWEKTFISTCICQRIFTSKTYKEKDRQLNRKMTKSPY